MELKLRKLAGAAAIGSAVLLSGQALAQSKDTSSEQAQTAQAQDDGKKDWGWMGIFGLAGLAGLLRRRRGDDSVRLETAKRGV